MDIKLSNYDTAMLFGVLLLARRYGDLQTSDWASNFRDRLTKLMDSEDETVNDNETVVDNEDTQPVD